MSKWINVKDRLPKNYGVYLVTNGKAVDISKFSHCFNKDKTCFLDFDEEITHWQPLPEPPKDNA